MTHPTQILDALGKVPAALERGDARHTVLQPVRLSVERRGEVLALAVTPRAKKDWRLKPPVPGEVVDPRADRPVESFLVGDAGLVLSRRFQRVGVLGALRKGFTDSFEMVRDVGRNLAMLLHGRGLNQVGGPVVIVRSLGNAAAVGIYELLRWAANLSIMIGVFNLLPLPALDGGRIVFVLVDWIYITAFRRRELDRKVEGWVHAVGLIALLILMVLVTVRDLTR